MAKLLKLRRGTTAEHSSFTGAEGEVTVDTTKDTVVVHDGSTAGGVPLAKESAIPTATSDLTNDSNFLASSDIGVTVQGYDADTAKYDDVTANFTGTLQNGGSNVVVDTDIGSAVQAYNSNLTAINQALTSSSSPTFVTLNATTVDLGNWTVTESAGVLYFATGGTNKMKLDASGNLTVTGDVTAYGTV